MTPYHKNIGRSLLKEPKFYFYDHANIEQDNGAHFENIVASALLKRLHYLEDTTGTETKLHYLRTKDKREIDFAIVINKQLRYLIETKLSDDSPSKHFDHFIAKMNLQNNIKAIQLVKNLSREKTTNTGIEVRSGANWLANDIVKISD